MKYRKKPVIVDAITFDEFIQYGIDHGAETVNGIPLRFEYKGHMVTCGNEYCYVIPTMEGDHVFTADDMLITGVQGEIYPCKRFIFEKTYEIVSNDENKDIAYGETADQHIKEIEEQVERYEDQHYGEWITYEHTLEYALKEYIAQLFNKNKELNDSINKLEITLSSVRADRDQLLADFREESSKLNPCRFCKHDNEIGELQGICKDCIINEEKWEWRGIPDSI